MCVVYVCCVLDAGQEGGRGEGRVRSSTADQKAESTENKEHKSV